MENTSTTSETKQVSVDLTPEQYAFLTNWQKTHEQELGIEVPIGAMVRKAVDMAMKSNAKREERSSEDRPPFRDRPAGRPMGRPAGRSFGDKSGFGAKPRSFGARPPMGAGSRGPKFDMLSPRKPRTFDK